MSSLAPEQSPQDSIQRFLALASVALVVAILWVGQSVVVPLVFASLLAFLLSPAVGRLMRWGLNKIIAITLIVLAGFAIMGALGWLVTVQTFNLAQELPAYERNMREKIVALKMPKTPVSLERTSEMIKNLQREATEREPKANGSPSTSDEPAPVRVSVAKEERTSFQLLRNYSGSVLRPLAFGGIVIVLFVAMLIGREDLRDRFIKVVSAGQINLATQALDDAARRVTRYLLMQLVVNATYGIPVGLGLYFIGIPNAPLWGLLATLLRFIPFLGPWIAAVFPLALAVAVDPGWTMVLSTLALFVVMELVSNNIVEVWLYGATTGISNLALLVAAVFWTSLWGPIGLILSTPLTVCLLVLGKYVPGARFLSTLLGSEPVLDPPSQMYQRMLARDSDEMLDLAIDFIHQRSLATFYDEMLLPALLMAEQDRHRGVLAEVRQLFIFRAGRELIEELERRGEGETKPTPKATTLPADENAPLIWGVPASDDADELVGLMVRHLLRERGLRTVVSPVAASPAEQAEALHQEVAAAAFVSALPPSALSAAGRACRRIKASSARLPVVVGVWTRQASSEDLMDRLRHANPDAVVTKLNEAVVEIERVARGALAPVDGSRTDAPAQADQPALPTADVSLGLEDSEPEAWIERVTRALAQLFDVPVSLVTFMATDEAFWPSRLGLKSGEESEREPQLRAFLDDAATEENPLVVDDVRKDRRLSHVALVRERGVRLLVNLALRTEAGRVVGHLCLVDTNPHETTDDQRERIRVYGQELVAAVEALNASGDAPSSGTELKVDV